MVPDPDLMRELLFVLEARQLSPRASVFISIDAEAEELDCPPASLEDGLNALLDLEYIEGPGADEPGLWIFRKLTRKGIAFLRAARNPKEWERMKAYHNKRRLAENL